MSACTICGGRAVVREQRTIYWCATHGEKDRPKPDQGAERRLSRIRTIAQQASAKHDAADLFAMLLAISLEADGVESESGRWL